MTERQRMTMNDERKLTSYDDLVAEYRTTMVETSTGKVFEVQNVSPGDLLLIAGSPLMAELTLQGLDLKDAGTVSESVMAMPPAKQLQLISNPDFLRTVKKTVCLGVISVNLVDKEQKDCDAEVQEVSLARLLLPELFQIFTAILQISATDQEVKDFYSFREESAILQDDYGEDTPVGEGIPQEAVGDSVPQTEESAVDVGD